MKHNFKKTYEERGIYLRISVTSLGFPHSGLKFSFCIRSPNTKPELSPGRILETCKPRLEKEWQSKHLDPERTLPQN